MRKWAVIFGLIPTLAAAADWHPITDAKGGGRLIVDIESIDFSVYQEGKRQGIRATATMQLLDSGEILDPFTAVIDVDECLTKQRGVLLNVYADGDIDKYFWHVNGNKIYDAQAQWLCAVVTEADRSNKEKKEQKDSTKKYL